MKTWEFIGQLGVRIGELLGREARGVDGGQGGDWVEVLGTPAYVFGIAMETWQGNVYPIGAASFEAMDDEVTNGMVFNVILETGIDTDPKVYVPLGVEAVATAIVGAIREYEITLAATAAPLRNRP